MRRKPPASDQLSGVKWNWIDTSNLVWGLAIGVGFMFLELSGVWDAFGWRTLSQTVWADEARYHILYLLVGALLCGLALHFLSRVPLGFALAIGLVVAVLSHLLDGWPKW